jgi:hypothetical protein
LWEEEKQTVIVEKVWGRWNHFVGQAPGTDKTFFPRRFLSKTAGKTLLTFSNILKNNMYKSRATSPKEKGQIYLETTQPTG